MMPGSFYHESLFFGVNPQKADVVPLLDAYLQEAQRDKKGVLNKAYERWFGQTYFQKRLMFLSENYLWILLAVVLTIAVFIFFNVVLRSKVKRSVHEINRQKSYFENLFKIHSRRHRHPGRAQPRGGHEPGVSDPCSAFRSPRSRGGTGQPDLYGRNADQGVRLEPAGSSAGRGFMPTASAKTNRA